LLLADERIEDVELVRGTAEAPLLELPGHRDQSLRRARDVLTGGAAAPRVRARATVGEDASREHEPVLVLGSELRQRVERFLLEQCRRKVELGFDIRLLRARADEGGVALGPEQQPDGLREDRLAGPGLARDRVQ